MRECHSLCRPFYHKHPRLSGKFAARSTGRGGYARVPKKTPLPSHNSPKAPANAVAFLVTRGFAGRLSIGWGEFVTDSIRKARVDASETCNGRRHPPAHRAGSAMRHLDGGYPQPLRGWAKFVSPSKWLQACAPVGAFPYLATLMQGPHRRAICCRPSVAGAPGYLAPKVRCI